MPNRTANLIDMVLWFCAGLQAVVVYFTPFWGLFGAIIMYLTYRNNERRKNRLLDLQVDEIEKRHAIMMSMYKIPEDND